MWKSREPARPPSRDSHNAPPPLHLYGTKAMEIAAMWKSRDALPTPVPRFPQRLDNPRSPSLTRG